MTHNFMLCQTPCPCQLSQSLFFSFFFHFSSHFPVSSLFAHPMLPTSATPTLCLSKPPHLVLLGCPWQGCSIAQGVGSFLEYPPFWGLGWWMSVLSLCLHTAGGILQLFWLSGGESVTRAGTLSTPKAWGFCTAGHQQSDLEKKKNVEQSCCCEVWWKYLSKSWNYRGSFGTEQQKKLEAGAVVRKLLLFGWKVFHGRQDKGRGA